MIGKLLGAAVRVATCPLDAAEIVMDAATGGDGSKETRKTPLTEMRDELAEVLEDIDE